MPIRPSFVLLVLFICSGCDSFVVEFPDSSEPLKFTASNVDQDSKTYQDGGLKILTWNMRFGIGRLPFFGDSCGDEVIAYETTVASTMQAIAETLNVIDADIVLLQEVDLESKRTGYWNQIQYLLDNTYLNYGVYASTWQSDFIPTDGIGRVNTGNAILSKFEIGSAERIQLRLRTDQSDLVQYFYLRRNILKAEIPELTSGQKKFFAVNIHATAFATDDTKQQHVDRYLEVLGKIDSDGDVFISGGDLNAVPPGAVIDYCMNDICDGEDFHVAGAEPFHKEGSYFQNFQNEPDILVPLYERYQPAIEVEAINQPENYTHAPITSMLNDSTIRKYDRKIDYLFTNMEWDDSSGSTHQSCWEISDHMPISASVRPITGD